MSSEDTSAEFKKLIEEVGIRKAIEKMKEKGIVYNEDFTEAHRTDPIFSSPLTTPMSTSVKQVVLIDTAFTQRRVDGNLYPFTHVRPNEEPQKLPFTNSLLNLIQCILLDDNFLELLVTESSSQTNISSSEPSITR